MKRFWLVITFLLLLVATAHAQDTGAADTKAPRRLLLVVTRQVDGSLAANDLLMLSRSVQVQLQKATNEIVVVEPSEPVTDISAARLAEAAKVEGADSWLWVIAGGGWTTLKLAVQSFDLISNSLVLDSALAREGWQSPQDLAMETWDDIAQPLAGHFHMVTAAAVQQGPVLALLTITALPGTKITGLGGPALTADENGMTSREVSAPRQYTLRASLRGHAYVSKPVFVTSERVITLEQRQISSWAVDLSLQDRAYPGVALGWSPVPGVFTVKLGFTSYLVGIPLDSSGLLSSQPLTDLVLQADLYFSPVPEALRVYSGFGVYLRISHSASSLVSLDPLSFGGIKSILGVEFPVSSQGSLFMEYAPTAYFTAFPELLRASLGPGNSPPGWEFGTAVGINFLSFRAGWRWQL